MNDLLQESETLQKEFRDLIDNIPSSKDFDSYYKYEVETSKHYRAIAHKSEMLVGVQDLVIKMQAKELSKYHE